MSYLSRIIGSLTVSGSISASGAVNTPSYQVTVSGAPIPTLVDSTGYFNIDFTNSPGLQTVTISGTTVFSGVNYTAGGAATVRVNVSGASSVGVYFPTEWNWVSTMPGGIATGRFAILTLNTFTANDSGVCGSWAVAP